MALVPVEQFRCTRKDNKDCSSGCREGECVWERSIAPESAVRLQPLHNVTPKGVLRPALCHASATREGP